MEFRVLRRDDEPDIVDHLVRLISRKLDYDSLLSDETARELTHNQLAQMAISLKRHLN